MTSIRFLSLCLTLALCLSVLSGCGVKRDAYDVPVIPLPETFRQTPATDTSSDMKFEGIPLDSILPEWWRVLGNEELDRLMDMAMARNQDLRIASMRVAHTQARFEQAMGTRLPTVSVPARVGVEAPEQGIGDNPRGESVRSRNIFQISLRGDWRPDIWGDQKAEAEAARYRLWKTTFDHDIVSMNVIAEVALAYAEYLSLTDRLHLAWETERVVEQMLQAVQDRVDHGDATMLDYEQQRSAVYGVKAIIPELELQRDEVQHRLSRITGVTPADLETTGETLESLALPRMIPGVPSSLLLRRPDVRSVEADLLAADADIDVARARVLPPLDLTSQIGYGSRYFSEWFMPHSLAYNAIASLTATLFDGGVRRKERDFAEARNEELVELYVRVLYDAVREVEDALAVLRRTEQRLAALDVACEASGRALEYSQTLYNLQAVDFLTLLMTERTHHQNLDDRLQVRLDRHRGLIRLFRALGGGVPVSAPLPGKGVRPDVALATVGGRIQTDQLVPLEETGVIWGLEEKTPASADTWLVELSGLYDRAAVLATLRDLRQEHPELMIDRELLALESGVERADGEERIHWYRLRLLPETSLEEAEAACRTLQRAKRRCQVVSP
ncbi:efflux transporter outer membrane subunit [Desulfonatronum thioautotrophicum]|uniref:efflux transporter outer membrane subunit n=1 Tax=Desulfonatronum thioautotrophicum TaxID=617001 RepID=UPI0005EB1B16|nr:efflux transporter outer membrane subunit [Desulfonatronum thioautotrophicum]